MTEFPMQHRMRIIVLIACTRILMPAMLSAKLCKIILFYLL
jgi:hypothetical protein